MRLTSLRLQKFGAFAGRSLDFKPGARLHLVYGANEAGKSTALAAVNCLLFGFPKRTAYDFLPGKGELRIGGVIQANGHPALSFIRRKGDKRTLLDGTGAPIADEALAPYLGAASKEIFANAFGLDAEALRNGAEEFLKSRGEVGESLMAAASGLRGLSDLRKSIEKEADGIYTRQASTKRWNEISRRYESAEKARREHELLAGKWKQNEDDIADCLQRLADVDDMSAKVTAGIDRLRRLKRLAPLIARLSASAAELAALGTLPDLPTGFAPRLGAALDAVEHASELRAQVAEASVGAAKELADIKVDSALLARSAEVAASFSGSGAYRKANEDLPRVLAHRDDCEAELNFKASQLGLGDSSELENILPSAPAQALSVKLMVEGADFAASIEALEAKLTDEKAALENIDRARKSRGFLTDPAPLREQFAGFSDIRARIQRRDDAESQLRAEEAALREEAARLSPPVADLETLASAALPAAETLARFRSEFEAVERERQRLDDEIEAAGTEIRAARDKLGALEALGPLATRERIDEARRRRDELWAGFGARVASAQLIPPDEIARYLLAVGEADRLADEAARDAARVAEHALRNRALNTAQLRNVGAQDKRAANRETATRTQARWDAQWRPANVAPRAPVEMTAWHSSLRGLFDRRSRVVERRQAQAQLNAEIAAAARPLAALAERIGLAVLEGLDAGRLAAQIDARLQIIETAWSEASGAEQTRRDTSARIEKFTRDLEAQIPRQAEWRERWKKSAPALGLRPDATREEAEAAINIWNTVPAGIRRRDDEARRVTGMQRDISGFEKESRALVDSLARDLAQLSPADAVKALNERVSEASKAEGRYHEGEKRVKQAEDSLLAAENTHAEALARLAAVTGLLPAGADPLILRADLGVRDKILSDIADARRELIDHADGLAEAHIREELAGFDPATTEASIEQFLTESGRLDDKAREIVGRKARLEGQRVDWEKGVGAELAMQQRRNAEAELRDAAHEWAVLKVSALLLEHALAHHRVGQRDPLILRAGEFFATLTGGAFMGLEQAFGDDDLPRLAGRRASGEIVRIDGLNEPRSPMSTGTLDQLYLAVRLAYIEDYCSRAEPIPFIGDDLFTSFDDARTGFGVDALASLSTRTQTILFTHHRHVVEIARARLGEGLDLMELS